MCTSLECLLHEFIWLIKFRSAILFNSQVKMIVLSHVLGPFLEALLLFSSIFINSDPTPDTKICIAFVK